MNAPATLVDRATGEIHSLKQPAAAVDTDFERLLQQDAFSTRDLLGGDILDKVLRLADIMASGKVTCPKHLQGNVGDCAAVIGQAMRWRMDHNAVAQKTHVVNGVLGYEAQLVNAVVQQSGAIRGHFEYQYRPDGTGVECRVGAVLRGETELTWNEWHSSNNVKVKNSPLWATNPKQQMGYLQVKNWARAYCPGAILGVYSDDELEDLADATPPAARGPQRKSTAETSVANATPATPPTPTAAPPAVDNTAAPPPPAVAGSISGGQVAYLRNKLKAAGTEEASVCDRFQITGIELLTAEQFDTLKAELLKV